MHSQAWTIHQGDGPVVAAAVHSGHAVREELSALLALEPHQRRREEDPFTDIWTTVAGTRIIGHRSRFEVDLNRPPEKAVYRTPDDAWGLRVWKTELPDSLVEASMAIYDAFYADVHRCLTELVAQHGRVIVYDLHSYNHRRQGPDGAHADSETNPEVNVGTGTMPDGRWRMVVDRFLAGLRGFSYQGRSLDARENVKFFGGHFPRWIHGQFPDSVCVLSIEFKKFFMDEWTGEGDTDVIETLRAALESTVDGVSEELARL